MLRDISPDSELLAAPKVPLQLGDILNNGSQEQFSDRDTGEYHFALKIYMKNCLLEREAYVKRLHWKRTKNEQKKISCRS